MPRTCSICTHEERQAIDVALVKKTPFRNIAEQCSVSLGALSRHYNEHLPAHLVKAKEEADIAHAIDVVEQLKAINSVCLRILKNARDSGEDRLALSAVDRIYRQIELQAKLLGELQAQQTTVNVLVASPEWLHVRATLLGALETYPEARQAVAGALLEVESAPGQ